MWVVYGGKGGGFAGARSPICVILVFWGDEISFTIVSGMNTNLIDGLQYQISLYYILSCP